MSLTLQLALQGRHRGARTDWQWLARIRNADRVCPFSMSRHIYINTWDLTSGFKKIRKMCEVEAFFCQSAKVFFLVSRLLPILHFRVLV